jgi:predicted  nucleic acid-binding Zn-ribbon protein
LTGPGAALHYGVVSDGGEPNNLENLTLRYLRRIDRKVDGLAERLGNVEADVGTLKADVGELKADVGELKVDVRVLKGDVRRLDDRGDALEDKLDQLRRATFAGFKAVGERFDGLDRRIDHLILGPMGDTVRDLVGRVERLENQAVEPGE